MAPELSSTNHCPDRSSVLLLARAPRPCRNSSPPRSTSSASTGPRSSKPSSCSPPPTPPPASSTPSSPTPAPTTTASPPLAPQRLERHTPPGRRTLSLQTAGAPLADSLSREPYSCEMDAPFLDQGGSAALRHARHLAAGCGPGGDHSAGEGQSDSGVLHLHPSRAKRCGSLRVRRDFLVLVSAPARTERQTFDARGRVQVDVFTLTLP